MPAVGREGDRLDGTACDIRVDGHSRVTGGNALIPLSPRRLVLRSVIEVAIREKVAANRK